MLKNICWMLLIFFNNYNNSILQYYTVISVSYPQEAFDVYYNIEENNKDTRKKLLFIKEQ